MHPLYYLDLSFLDLTMNYSVHLSLHPFALDQHNQDITLDFLYRLFKFCSGKAVPRRTFLKLKQKMNEAALSSSSPPFILTTELVCPLSNEETIAILDRIVGLINSNTPLTDDTILRICAFFRQSKKTNFIKIHRNMGRTKQQYLQTLESLLSLPIDILKQSPVEYLLHRVQDVYRGFDENWDDLCFDTVPLFLDALKLDQPRSNKHTKELHGKFLDFLLDSLEHACSRADRLHPAHFEQFINLSEEFIFTHYSRQLHSTTEDNETWTNDLVRVLRACHHSVFIEGLGKLGFFARVVNEFIDSCDASSSTKMLSCGVDRPQIWRSRARESFDEEGWEDAMELNLIKNETDANDNETRKTRNKRWMMCLYGANLNLV
ncbi:hypothetical protein BLNAU_11249 [Blattamonas nauphoetae]|uniref:Uncharacterized protein n=1 Tax=Blattamonas nauphoetae TaxID=2049346 RepID=A0ABQ9XSM6_9EUKA|nr:hypothetical protein BLNAU_11249 [Blattamonas nauphoetae]